MELATSTAYYNHFRIKPGKLELLFLTFKNCINNEDMFGYSNKM